MNDIVERLLNYDDMDEYHDVRREAAIEIKQLRAGAQAMTDIDERLRVVLGHVEDLRAENAQLRSTLVTKRDMADAEKLAKMIAEHLLDDEPFEVIDWRHDIAQAIADGRRAPEPKS